MNDIERQGFNGTFLGIYQNGADIYAPARGEPIERYRGRMSRIIAGFDSFTERSGRPLSEGQIRNRELCRSRAKAAR